MPNLRIALAQICPVSAESGPPKLEKPHTTSPFHSVDANLAEVVVRVAEAKDKGADVVVFPEYFLQGIGDDNRQYTTFPSKHLTTFLQHLAKKHGIAIVGTIVHGSLPASAGNAPFPEDDPFGHLLTTKPGGKITPGQLAWAKWLEAHPPAWEDGVRPILKNTAFFIDDSGALVGEYVKQNLWHPEREWLTFGEEHPVVFETKWGKAGLQICWDVSHHGGAQKIADQDAKLIFHPTYWLATDSEPYMSRHARSKDYETSAVSALCFTRAYETETVWIMCNAGGDDKEGFMGGSAVWAPLVGRAGGCGVAPEMAIVDIDVDAVLADSRELHKVQEDWRAKQEKERAKEGKAKLD